MKGLYVSEQKYIKVRFISFEAYKLLKSLGYRIAVVC